MGLLLRLERHLLVYTSNYITMLTYGVGSLVIQAHARVAIGTME